MIKFCHHTSALCLPVCSPSPTLLSSQRQQKQTRSSALGKLNGIYPERSLFRLSWPGTSLSSLSTLHYSFSLTTNILHLRSFCSVQHSVNYLNRLKSQDIARPPPPLLPPPPSFFAFVLSVKNTPFSHLS